MSTPHAEKSFAEEIQWWTKVFGHWGKNQTPTFTPMLHVHPSAQL